MMLCNSRRQAGAYRQLRWNYGTTMVELWMNLWETFIDGCFGGKATEEFAMQRENGENALDLNPVNTNVVIIFDLVIKRLIV